MQSTFFTVYDLYTPEEAQGIVDQIDGLEWQKGKARTPELTEKVKHNLELIGTRDKPAVDALLKGHARRLMDFGKIKSDHYPKCCCPPKFNKFMGGGNYDRHTDSPVMARVRTDLACTTFLKDPDSYEGGELNVEDHYGNVHSFKGQPGQVVVYPCGQPHWVSPVPKGERISIICWIQSHIRDFHQRSMLRRFIGALRKIEPLSLEDDLHREVWTELGGIHADLFRSWAE